MLVLGLFGLPDTDVGPVGRPVSKLALEGTGGVMDSAAMVILASSLSWCFFLFTTDTEKLSSSLAVLAEIF